MNGIATPGPLARDHSFLRWFLIATALLGVAAVVAVANLRTLNRDAATLRDELLGALDESPRMRIQVSAGPFLLTVVRAGLNLIPDIPEEARLATRAVRSASVGVYQLTHVVFADAAMIAAADAKMRRRGWERVVVVNHQDGSVLAYAPSSGGSGSRQKVCVAVFDGSQLVVVAGMIAGEPLRKLAEQHGFEGLTAL